MKELLKRAMPQNFNDFLCLFLIALIVALWILAGTKIAPTITLADGQVLQVTYIPQITV